MSVVLALAREPLQWLRSGGRPTRIGMAKRLLYRWRSYWFERNLALQRQLSTGSCASPIADPVFILGLWRSGTTFLHELLAACPGMQSPATWQCMNASTFRLQPPPRAGKAARRPMDAMLVDALSPQEDEFALLTLGVPSVYRGFLDPRRLPELTRWLDPESWALDRPAGWLERWLEFLAWVVDGEERRLLLKSPGHTFRIRAITQIFPRASYVWLTRQENDLFFSNRKMWLSMFQRYALWDWKLEELDEFLALAFRHAADCLRMLLAEVGADRVAVVDFQQLVDSPLETVTRLNRRIGLGEGTTIKSAIASALRQRAPHTRDTYEEHVPSVADVAVAQLGRMQRAALETHGVLTA